MIVNNVQGDFTNCSDEFITMSHEFSGVVEVWKLTIIYSV
jgi:hypothetical protein